MPYDSGYICPSLDVGRGERGRASISRRQTTIPEVLHHGLVYFYYISYVLDMYNNYRSSSSYSITIYVML
jgi:hypothetical protein